MPDNFTGTYIAWPKENLRSLIFSWTAFSFDYCVHSSRHHFHNLMQSHNIYFLQELDSFLAKIMLLTVGESNHSWESKGLFTQSSFLLWKMWDAGSGMGNKSKVFVLNRFELDATKGIRGIRLPTWLHTASVKVKRMDAKHVMLLYFTVK